MESQEANMGIHVAPRRLSVESENDAIEGFAHPSGDHGRVGKHSSPPGGIVGDRGRVAGAMGKDSATVAVRVSGIATQDGGGSGGRLRTALDRNLPDNIMQGRQGRDFVKDGEDADENEENDEAIPCIVSSYAGYSKKGFAPYNPRKRNQDALVMAEDPSTASLFFAVMDGHGEVGDKVAQAFRRGLAPLIFDHPAWEASPETAVVESIAKIESSLLADPSVDTEFSGTTLVSVCIRGSQLLLTNVGDSRVTLGRRRVPGEESIVGGEHGAWVERGRSSLVAQPLTVDHKPDTPAEKQRILCAGGRVFSVEYADGVDGPPRVWLGNMDMPGLAMSRSLGDAIAHTAGVISDPDTYRCDLVDGGCRTGYEGETYEGASGGEAVVIILATDGLWEFITDQEAVDIVSQCSEPRQAVERLIHEAGERWMKEEQVIDDTTVCVAFIKNWVVGTGGGQG